MALIYANAGRAAGARTPPPEPKQPHLAAGLASATHFLVKLVLAAPASFFSAAWASHDGARRRSRTS